MSHEIYNNAFVSYRQPAWHKLGIVFDQPIDAAEAFELMGRYTPKHPKIRRLRSEMTALKKQIEIETSKIVAGTSGRTMVSPGPMTALGNFWKALMGAGSALVPSSM